MSGEHSRSSDHHHDHGSESCDTVGRHGMLLFGADPVYLSHLPMWVCPHNRQCYVEVAPDGTSVELLRADRARHGDGMYTFDPDLFPIAELEPHDGVPARTSLRGTLVRGHFERGGTPIARGVQVDVRQVVWYRELDADAIPEPGQSLEYLCFGRGGSMYLAHELRTRPSFDQVLTVRFIPGTVQTLVGHPLDDDVAAIQFDQAQPVTFGRDDTVKCRLTAGEVTTAVFSLTRSPSASRGFSVEVEIERELYLEINELV